MSQAAQRLEVMPVPNYADALGHSKRPRHWGRSREPHCELDTWRIHE